MERYFYAVFRKPQSSFSPSSISPGCPAVTVSGKRLVNTERKSLPLLTAGGRLGEILRTRHGGGKEEQNFAFFIFASTCGYKPDGCGDDFGLSVPLDYWVWRTVRDILKHVVEKDCGCVIMEGHTRVNASVELWFCGLLMLLHPVSGHCEAIERTGLDIDDLLRASRAIY